MICLDAGAEISGKALALSMLGGWIALPLLLPTLAQRWGKRGWNWCIKQVVVWLVKR